VTSVLTVVVLVVLVAVVAWLLLALAGANRTITALRAERAADEPGPARHLSAGLPAGASAPAIELLGDDLGGSRHLVTFVDPDCAACDDLVPALIRAADERRVPQTVLVSRGSAADHPRSWLESADRSRLVTEAGSEITEAYGVDVTPTAFVVDEGGLIVGSGVAATIDDVLALVDDVDGVRIARGTDEHQEVTRGSA
jgi:hypothetical protein